MTDQEIILKSSEQKKIADKILEESNILEILSQYGVPTVVGSYSYDLMTAPDIDVHVVVDKLDRDSVFKIFNTLVEENYFYAYKIADFYEKAKRPGIDKGYLIGLRYWTPDAKWSSRWKFDIWFLEKENPYQEEVAKMIRDNINSEKRLDILRLKNWRDNFNTGIEAYNIYKGVLENGVKTPEELQAYLLHGAKK